MTPHTAWRLSHRDEPAPMGLGWGVADLIRAANRAVAIFGYGGFPRNRPRLGENLLAAIGSHVDL
jgi:hypothetical protein